MGRCAIQTFCSDWPVSCCFGYRLKAYEVCLDVLFKQEVTFRVDYNVPSINRDFGTVFLGDKNVAMLVAGGGWAKVENRVLYPDVPC